MPSECPPLPSGTVLADRFVVGEVLGRGAFGIVYRGEDLRWGELCTIKELAPSQAVRGPGGLLQLPGDERYRRRLCERFLDEAERIARLRAEGILPPRAWFVQNGTAYVVTEHADGVETLEHRIASRGSLPIGEAMGVAESLLRTLGTLHRAGILHRDVKPSNILVGPGGKLWLIDFGAALEWHADSGNAHAVLFTPGYAPPEQLDRRGLRGPATDVYAVGATLYELLTGSPPPSASERLAGAAVPSLRVLRPDVDPSVCEAIEAALELDPELRPQSAPELLARLQSGMVGGPLDGTWRDFDERAVRLAGLRFGRWECPGCGGVLERVKPLRRGQCPVCREGAVRPREVPQDVCPVCRAGVLRRWPSAIPVCPSCGTGLMRRKQGLIGRARRLQCQRCGFALEQTQDGRWRAISEATGSAAAGEERTAEEWVGASGRSATIDVCDSCGAQLDLEPDGRWRLAWSGGERLEWERLYREEWACVAAGLEPTAGNAECDRCGAEYFVDGERVTLLGCHRDSFGFGERHQGRCFDWDQLAWAGVGKTSLLPGVRCAGCGTEFDFAGDQLRLVRGEGRLAGVPGQTLSIEDWHRVAHRLPRREEEGLFQERFDEAIVSAYERGQIHLGGKPGLLWDGLANWRWDGVRSTREGRSRVLIDGSSVRVRRLPRSLVVPMDGLLKVTDAEGDGLLLETKGGSLALWPEPIVLAVRLASGARRVPLDVVSLKRRLRDLAGNRNFP